MSPLWLRSLEVFFRSHSGLGAGLLGLGVVVSVLGVCAGLVLSVLAVGVNAGLVLRPWWSA